MIVKETGFAYEFEVGGVVRPVRWSATGGELTIGEMTAAEARALLAALSTGRLAGVALRHSAANQRPQPAEPQPRKPKQFDVAEDVREELAPVPEPAIDPGASAPVEAVAEPGPDPVPTPEAVATAMAELEEPKRAARKARAKKEPEPPPPPGRASVDLVMADLTGDDPQIASIAAAITPEQREQIADAAKAAGQAIDALRDATGLPDPACEHEQDAGRSMGGHGQDGPDDIEDPFVTPAVSPIVSPVDEDDPFAPAGGKPNGKTPGMDPAQARAAFEVASSSAEEIAREAAEERAAIVAADAPTIVGADMPDDVRLAKSLRPAIVWLQQRGVRDPENLLAEITARKSDIPVLKGVANIKRRIGAVLDAMGELPEDLKATWS